MTDIAVDYVALARSGEVLARQGTHAAALERYVRTECDISDSGPTGTASSPSAAAAVPAWRTR